MSALGSLAAGTLGDAMLFPGWFNSRRFLAAVFNSRVCLAVDNQRTRSGTKHALYFECEDAAHQGQDLP